jgi:hypothetical protein
MNSSSQEIARWVDDAVSTTPVYDLHTHLYPISFGKLGLWGVEELITYHYLIAESIRATKLPYEQYWAMTRAQQADFIWKALFLDRAPISEACRGVLTVLNKLGIDLSGKSLKPAREFYNSQSPQGFMDTAFKLSNVHTLVMTNDVFDKTEYDIWMSKPEVPSRFKAVLRIDPLLLGWPKVGETLKAYGYNVSSDLGPGTMEEIRRFLADWLDRMKAIYVACSLPPSWCYPDASPATKVLNEALLPVCRERNKPFAMMIGVNKLINPQLKLAGDSLGKADIFSLERILSLHPHNRFLVTMLSRENQHELAVTARKFSNLFVFGCWWFMNNPVLIEEITRMRMELLGESFTPQHSDARILDQLLYKWDHSREIIAKVLKDKFNDLARTGWPVSKAEVERTVRGYLSDNFKNFIEA